LTESRFAVFFEKKTAKTRFYQKCENKEISEEVWPAVKVSNSVWVNNSAWVWMRLGENM
jgi:hypothetical protein